MVSKHKLLHISLSAEAASPIRTTLVPPNPPEILPAGLGMHIKAFTSFRHKTGAGRVRGLQGSGACDGVGTMLLGSGELPHEIWYPALPPPNREIPRDPIPPPMHDLGLIVCLACTKDS